MSTIELPDGYIKDSDQAFLSITSHYKSNRIPEIMRKLSDSHFAIEHLSQAVEVLKQFKDQESRLTAYEANVALTSVSNSNAFLLGVVNRLGICIA